MDACLAVLENGLTHEDERIRLLAAQVLDEMGNPLDQLLPICKL